MRFQLFFPGLKLEKNMYGWKSLYMLIVWFTIKFLGIELGNLSAQSLERDFQSCDLNYYDIFCGGGGFVQHTTRK